MEQDWIEVQTVEYRNYKIVIYIKVDIVSMVVERIFFGYEVLDSEGEVVSEDFCTDDDGIFDIGACLENAKNDIVQEEEEETDPDDDAKHNQCLNDIERGK